MKENEVGGDQTFIFSEHTRFMFVRYKMNKEKKVNNLCKKNLTRFSLSSSDQRRPLSIIFLTFFRKNRLLYNR